MTADPFVGGACVVVAPFDAVVPARATVRSVLAAGNLPCVVIDVDGCYRPVADEQVFLLADLVTELHVEAEAAIAVATLDSPDLSFYAGVIGASIAMSRGCSGVVVLGAGVVVHDDLTRVLAAPGPILAVPQVDSLGARRRATGPLHERRRPPGGSATVEGGRVGPLCSRSFFAVQSAEQAAALRVAAADWRVADRALDLVVATHGVVSPELAVLTPWRALGTTSLDPAGRLQVNGGRVTAVDLTALDARRPWLLDADAHTSPRVLLSEQPALAQVVTDEARARLEDAASIAIASAPGGHGGPGDPPRARMDGALRGEARRAEQHSGELPDLLGLGQGVDVDTWALALVPDSSPQAVARYLAAFRAARPHLQQEFRQVPGVDSKRLARWALRRGAKRSDSDSLLTRSARATLDAGPSVAEAASGHPAPGVNVVGYLAGELGLGESARLVDTALQAGGVATSTFDVSGGIRSRRGAQFRESRPIVRDTTLVCVNGAETAAVMRRTGDLFAGSRVIGMWYWELEEFPRMHRVGFKFVDEVWVATEFMRDAIAPHAGEVPVRTVTPPLPQAGPDPGTVPERFGIPLDRPWFLFTFDYLSLAPRKNPYGLVDAFTRAFGGGPAEQRPSLVIKTINADKQPAHAERLALQVAGRPDVILIDDYLDDRERHVLVANCTCFVSLHRAEGLGLTVAEAMSWGKPVIVTAYGGVMQFCNDQNSYLVDWAVGAVEESTGPYRKGMVWAEPDLDQAAVVMRSVLDDPARAEVLGAQAAADIRQLHNAEVAGAQMRLALAEGASLWRAHGGEVRAARRAERQSSSTSPADTLGSGPDAHSAPIARVRSLGRSARARWRSARSGRPRPARR